MCETCLDNIRKNTESEDYNGLYVPALIEEVDRLKEELREEMEDATAATSQSIFYQDKLALANDEVDRLRTENQRLLDSNEELHRERSMQPGLAFEVSELRAENQRLVEACTDLLTEMEHVNVPSLGVLEKLRAAIEGK